MNVVIVAWHLYDLTPGLVGGGEALGCVDPVNHYEILMPDGMVRFPVLQNMRYRGVKH